ncbi:MAG: hypothetical protein ACYC5Y_12820 [Symbiobacteriia bacterium]
MQDRPVPELPPDLHHPALRLSPSGAPEPETPTEMEPIFDDPIIGWWENAWSLKGPAPGQDEPLV